ncbi:MAG: RdgB/HAM1 family non-canonical purine NTP pyrophosphatase [Sphingobacterium thalpophilum]
MELVFASSNEHKVNEIRAIVDEAIQLKSLNDIACFDDIPETGSTFEENAGQKSRYIYQKYRCDCFADDSGLEIDTLNAEPGVNSAHYSGTRDFQQNMQLVLNRMEGQKNRTARFRTVISLLLNGSEYLFEGSIEGKIMQEQSGSMGFGYDPIFKPDGYEISFAEMDPSEKNRISHRAIAVKKLISFLKTKI